MLCLSAPDQKPEELNHPELGFYAKPGNHCVVFDEIPDVLENPGKGWVIHYFDNTLEKYGNLLENDDLTDFPGFSVVYLRLAWSYLEPEEGKFNWEVIDAPIRRWTAAGKRIAFRVSCCESGSSQPFATPRWVREAGAAGFYFGADNTNWEPDYGDPVFLEKLENFLTVFAARYDGLPFVEFIDMGSYGVWGEWHTSCSCGRKWPEEVLRKHVDLHAKLFRKTPLLILYGAGRDLCRYARDRAGAGLRCDSIGVYSYYTEFGGYWSEEIAPGIDLGHFGDFWPRHPVVLEPAHYNHALQFNTWQNGSTLRRAVEELHSSWTTVHHWPRQWLEENRDLAVELGNKMGYWFFLKACSLPEKVLRGERFSTVMIWENRGAAPIYRKYKLAVSLLSADGNERFRSVHEGVDCREWMPGKVRVIQPVWEIPAAIPAGKYQLRIGLLRENEDETCAIRLGISGRDAQGFYPVAELEIV